MSVTIVRRASFGTLALLVARAAAAQPTLPAIDSVFAAFGRATPGCAVGVSDRGRVVERAYGMADLEHDVPNATTTRFEAGSVSKQITAAAVVLLALDGKLSFDDDVRKHFPELPDYGTRITVRHLLNHTSGLRDWGSVAAIGGWPRGTRVYTNDLTLEIARRQRALNYTPGAYYSYTNTGYSLLALLVGRVSGKPLAEFTRERIFAPLGMTSTSWRDDFTRVVPGRAIAYEPGADGTFRLDMPFENTYGHGGLLTTPADLLRFTANLESGTLGGPRFVEEMHRQARLTNGRTIPYASGINVMSYRGVPEVSHSGSTAGYRAYLARYPRQGVAVAVLCNHAAANATALAHRVAESFLGAAAASAAARPDSATAVARVTVPAERLAALAGTYRSARDGAPYRLALVDGTLRADGRTSLVPLGPSRFRVGAATLVVDDAAGGRRAALRVVSADGDTVRYEPVAAFTPTAAQLAAYVGTYVSAEAERTLVVESRDGQLRVRDEHGRTLGPLTPAYPDDFAGRTFDVHFTRNPNGTVTGFAVRDARVWNLKFERRM